MRWSMELNQYEIHYIPNAIIKGQTIANFTAKLTLNEELIGTNKDLLIGTKTPRTNKEQQG